MCFHSRIDKLWISLVILMWQLVEKKFYKLLSRSVWENILCNLLLAARACFRAFVGFCWQVERSYVSVSWVILLPSLWRHNGHHGVSNHQPHDCLLKPSSRHRSKKTSKRRVAGLCAGNSPVASQFPAQMTSNAENVSIWWRHHIRDIYWYIYMTFIRCRCCNQRLICMLGRFAVFHYILPFKLTSEFWANVQRIIRLLESILHSGDWML